MSPTGTRLPLSMVLALLVVVALVAFAVGKSRFVPPQEAATREQGESHGLALIDALEDTKKQAAYFFARLIGVGYGKGFGDACASLEASRPICVAAWQQANDACTDLSSEAEICLPPLPGYFELPDDLKRRVRSAFDRYVYEEFVRDACIEFAGPESLSAEFEAICAAALRPGGFTPDDRAQIG